MTAHTDTMTMACELWLKRFETALEAGDAERLAALFLESSHWRDVLALTWDITTVNGRDAICRALLHHRAEASPGSFTIRHERTGPRRVSRAGTEVIEAIFEFKAAVGRGSGVLRLTEDATSEGELRALTLLTGLDDLSEHMGHDESGSDHKDHARDFRGPNWLDNREVAADYADRDPEVVVVGGGQAGLSIAAQLTNLQVDTLVVDRGRRVGDNWRNRYHALTLHNQTHVNHLPFMPFPPNWPTYIPKDKLAGWFESYAESMEINFWTDTEFEGGSYDEKERRWTVTVRRGDGSTRTLRPRHVVLATGVSGIPNRPDIPSLDRFGGRVLHSSEYQDGGSWEGRNAIVIGTGNSGHDIAQDLHSGGAHVTMVQRSPTLIVNLEPSAQLPYALYGEGPPLEDCDLITVATPLTLLRKSHQAFTEQARTIDKPLLDRLEARGFRLDFGEDGTGWQFKYLTRGGGYYFNVGCSDLIADGEIGLVQWSDVEGFTEHGMALSDGGTVDADLVVLATGYKGQEYLVDKLFGANVAQRVGRVWGYGDDDELRNMFRRTGQPGLWFIAGSLAQCRIYSKYLGLQIKASELGLIS